MDSSSFLGTLCIITYNTTSNQSYVDYFCGAVTNVTQA
jgi:hypothetical protein